MKRSSRRPSRGPSTALFAMAVGAVALVAYIFSSPAAGPAPSGPARTSTVRPVADGTKAFAHVAFLASDELKGRKAGTPEYRRAAEYVAAEMQKIGLKPGGDNGTWFQEVPFKAWTDFVQPIRLEILKPARRVYFPGRERDFAPVRGTGSGTVRGGLVFAGYGVVSEKDNWNDYAALDVKGKIVLVMPDLPEPLGTDARADWSFSQKVKTAAEKGAVGLIEMDLPAPGDAAPQPGQRRPRPGMLTPGQCPDGFVVMRAGRNFLSDAFYLVEKSWRDLVSKTLRLKRSFTLDLGAEIEMEAHYHRGGPRRPQCHRHPAGHGPQAQGRGSDHGRPPRPPRRWRRRLDLSGRGRQRRLGRGRAGDGPGPRGGRVQAGPDHRLLLLGRGGGRARWARATTPNIPSSRSTRPPCT